MSEKKLTWWVFKCLATTLALGALIICLSQFRVYQRLEASFSRDELEGLSLLATEILTHHIDQISETPTESNKLCQELALRTKKRVAIITSEGTVLGDSVYGSGFSLDESIIAPGFSTFIDSTSEQRILSYILPIPTENGKIPLYLRMSTPITGNWTTIKVFLQELGFLILALLCLTTICSVVLSHKLTVSVRNILAAVQSFKPGDTAYRLPHSDFHEFQSLASALDVMADHLSNNYKLLHTQMIQWEAIFTNMHEGVLAVDHEHTIILINNAAKEFLGIKESYDVLQRPLLELVRNFEINTFLVALEDTGQFHESEMDLQNQFGPVRTFHISGLPVEFEKNKPPGFLLVFSEITQLKKLEKMRQDFVANVSHELKTPITAIKGVMETLSMSIHDDPKSAFKFISTIERNADRLNETINDLLHLSRLEYGDHRIQENFQVQNIQTTIQQAVEALNDKLERKRINCVQRIVNFPIYANHRLLDQALSNLIDNAIKYSSEGSEITITATTQTDQLEIVVKDTGVGIPPEHQTRIFERFYRVDKSRDRQTGGTGLGLAIVKHIVNLHNGRVKVESQLDKGSRFIIRLPLDRNQGDLADSKDTQSSS